MVKSCVSSPGALALGSKLMQVKVLQDNLQLDWKSFKTVFLNPFENWFPLTTAAHTTQIRKAWTRTGKQSKPRCPNPPKLHLPNRHHHLPDIPAAAAVLPKYLFEQSTGARLWELPIAVIKITSDRNWIRTIDALSFEIGMMFDQIEPHALSTVYTLQNVFCFHKRKDFKACSAIVSFAE